MGPFLFWLLLSSKVHCAEPDSGNRAEALFRAGRASLDRGDYDAACVAFEESNRQQPAPGTMANLADCEEHRGHLSSALTWFKEAANHLSEDDPRRSVLSARAVALGKRVPFVTIKLAPAAPTDTKIVLDSSALRLVDRDILIPLDPGDHQVILSAPGRIEQRLAFTLREGDERTLVVEPGPPAAPIATSSPNPGPVLQSSPNKQPDSRKLDERTLGYVLGGVGAASVGTALILGAVALGKKGTVDAHCDPATRLCNSQEGLDAASSGATVATVSTVSFLLGAALLGAGAYFVITSDETQSSTVVGGTVSPGGGLIHVARVF